MSSVLAQVLATKLDQDATLIAEMLAMIPSSAQHWHPDWPAPTPFNTTRLAAHLVDCMAGLVACFYRLHPHALTHFNTLREQLANAPDASLPESQAFFALCRTHIAEGFSHTTDLHLAQLIPTYFSPQGEVFLSVLLENAKHLNHHAYQLFLYLKLLGIPVSTQHLYHFRTAPE